MTLPFGALDPDARFVCIDMQRIFLEPGDWFCADGLAILPAAARLAAAAPGGCLFTRFITPSAPEAAGGTWRRFYERWRAVTTGEGGEAALDLQDSLAAFAAPGRVFDKTAYDAFASAEFAAFIDRTAPSALVLFGVETDACVLATALSAVDRGLRTVIATDAVASADREAHRAALDLIYPRFDRQIELAPTDAVLGSLR